jgi:hypothetical protein
MPVRDWIDVEALPFEALLLLVARSGGRVVLCPGANDVDDEAHHVLVTAGYAWSVFEEPGDGRKRKYWRTVGAEPCRSPGGEPQR